MLTNKRRIFKSAIDSRPLMQANGGQEGIETSDPFPWKKIPVLMQEPAVIFSFTHLPPFNPQENSWYSFLLEVESTPGP
jgi:hypothetical protein